MYLKYRLSLSPLKGVTNEESISGVSAKVRKLQKLDILIRDSIYGVLETLMKPRIPSVLLVYGIMGFGVILFSGFPLTIN